MFERKPVKVPSRLNEAYEYDRPVPFSRAMTIDFGPAVMVIVSGTASVNEEGLTVHGGDLKAQTVRTFGNLTAILEAAGAGWKDVIRTTIYLRDMRDYEEFNVYRLEIMNSYGLPFYPPSTCIEARLCREDLLVEIECMALIEKNRVA